MSSRGNILILILSFLGIVTGCMPLTHMSSAPTLRPGHLDLTTGANTFAGDGSGAAPVFGARIGVFPRVDIGFIEDCLSTNGDLKIHLITDEMAKFDLSASVGGGVSILAVYKYYNVIISKSFSKHTPYIAYRHLNLANDKTDEDEDYSTTEELMVSIIQDPTNDRAQFFIGDEYSISNRTFFVFEGMYLPLEDTTNLISINVGFKFRL